MRHLPSTFLGLLLAACAALAPARADETLLVVRPGGQGSAEQAQPRMDAFARELVVRAAALDGLRAHYVIDTAAAKEAIALRNVELSADVLLAGEPWEAFAERWAAFVRPDDVLAVWGHFHASLAAEAGLLLPAERIDVRVAAARHLGRRSGSDEQCAERLDLPFLHPDDPGRCARRMSLLTTIARELTRKG